jgi:hypothetical protein
VNPDTFGASAYIAMGEAVKTFAGIYNDRAKERASSEMANTRLAWAQRLQEASERPDDIQDDWSQKEADEYATFVNDKASKMNSTAAHHYRNMAMPHQERVHMHAMEIESDVLGRRKVTEFSRIANDAASMVVNSPFSYMDAAQALNEAAEGATSDDDKRTALLKEQQTKLFSVYADTLLQRGADGARMLLEDIEGYTIVDVDDKEKRGSAIDYNVDAGAREQAKTRAMAALKSYASADVASLKQMASDATRLNNSGTTYEHSSLTRESIQKTIPGREGVEIANQLEAGQEFAKVYQAMLSPDPGDGPIELSGIMHRAMLVAESRKDTSGMSPDEVMQYNSHQEMLSRAAEQIQAQWEKSPHEMAMRDPAVKYAYEKLTSPGAGPEAVSYYVATNDAVAASNGVRGRLLPEQASESFYASITGGDLGQTAGGLTGMDAAMAIVNQWGENSPRVMAEIFDKKPGDSAKFYAVLSMIEPGSVPNNAVRQAFGAVVNVANNRNVSGISADSIKTAISPYVQQLSKSLLYGGGYIASGTLDAMEAYVQDAVANRGMSQKAAEDDARKTFLDDRYTFVPTNGSSVTRIPKATVSDAGLIQDGIEATLEALSEGGTVNVPQQYSTTLDGLEAIRSEIPTSAKAITTNGDSGVIITWANNDTMLTQDGRQIFLTWDQLSKIGKYLSRQSTRSTRGLAMGIAKKVALEEINGITGKAE